MSHEKQPDENETDDDDGWTFDLTCDPADPMPRPVDVDNQTEEEILTFSRWLSRNHEAISEGKHFTCKPGYVA